MNMTFFGLQNPDNRCATNSVFQALYATYLGKDIFKFNDKSTIDKFIEKIANQSSFEALKSIQNMSNFLDVKYMMYIDKNELTKNNIKDKKILYKIVPNNAKILHDFELDGFFFELTSAIYFKKTGGHYISLVKLPNNNAIICNDMIIKSPKIENPRLNFYTFPYELIESGNVYICVGCIYQKINDNPI